MTMNICIYGASSKKTSEKYITEVEKLGEALALKGHSLVFGGGASGLMGAAARGFNKGGGKIIGAAPRFFDVDGILYDKCTEFIFTDTMRQRKKILEDKSDAFIVCPGGVGTFDEFFEIITLKQLGRHNKAIIIYNAGNYFDELLSLMDKAFKEDFLSEKTLSLYETVDNAEDVLSILESYKGETASVKDTKYI